MQAARKIGILKIGKFLIMAVKFFVVPPARTTRPMHRLSRLRTRALVLVLLALIPALFLALFSAWRIYESEVEHLRKQAATLSQLSAADLERTIAEAGRLLGVLAELPQVRGGDPATCSALLRRVAAHHPEYIQLGAGWPDGQVFCNSRPLNGPLNVASQPGWQQALETRQMVIGAYQLSSITGQPVLPVRYPALDEAGEVLMIVSAALDVRAFENLNRLIESQPQAEVTVFNADGLVIYHLPEAARWSGVSAAATQLWADIASSQPGASVTSSEFDGIERIYGVSRAVSHGPGTAFTTAVGIPAATALEQLGPQFALHAAGLLLAAALAVSVAWNWGNRGILQPLQNVLTAIERLKAGELEARAAAGSGEELDELARGFNEMAEALSQQVTRQRQLLDELAESEERLRLALEAASQGLYDLDVQSGATVVSPEYARMLDYEPDGFVETNALWRARLHPDDHAAVSEIYEAYIAGEIPEYRVEFRQRTRSGAWKWILSLGRIVSWDRQGRPLRMLGFHTDITERKAAEQTLRASEARYRELFHANPHPMWIYDLQTLAFLDVNQAAVTHYGYSRQEFLAMTLKDIRPAETVPRLLADVASSAQPLNESGVWRHIKKNGELITVEIRSHTVDFDGRPARLVLSHDVTERLAAEAEIRRLNAELEQRVQARTAQLTAANQELEAFSYTVSHDLRAPLRAIDGYSRILAEEYAAPLDQEGLRLLAVIRDNTHKMERLISDLLELARLSRSALDFSPVDMRALASAAYHELAEAGATETFQFELGALPQACGDARQLRQVWDNLLGNAIKYSRPKNVRWIAVEGREEVQELVYCVRDRGVGFNPDTAHKMFGLFQRLHTAEEFEGTGLGLAIVERIVLRHGGRVWAEGAPGEGAAIYFTLPIRECDDGRQA
jgi:PAS domain S-box-containing protein